jgi:uncharacterized protein (DUF2235 family)
MRQLVLLCDGTNNNLTGAARDTHVVTLAELLRADPDDERVVFYDPGVGNPGEVPGTTLWDKARRQFERIDGLAFGRGVFDNIAEGYRFLMRQWRSDQDEIWLFGFSRGAFTARSIAGLVNRFGILQPHMVSMVPTLLHLYFAEATPSVDAISGQASRLFAVAPQRKPFVHFVGVWDTVATVGTWPFSLRIKAKPTLQGKRFVHVRQALALDEHRAQFVPRAYAEDNGPIELADGKAGSVSQQWFRGAHCDVGGGYEPVEGWLARAPLAWLICEAVQCGLRLRHAGQPLNSEASAGAAATRVIEQVTGKPDLVMSGAAHPLVHCQLHITPLWALTGMTLRNTRVVAMDDVADVPARMGEHPSVASWNAVFPNDTAWRRSGLTAGWWLMLAIACCLLIGIGHFALGATWGVEACLNANLQFQIWQLTAIFSADPVGWTTLKAFKSPRWAAVWDLALIVSYAYVLSTLAARAFAHAAGLNRLGRAVPRALKVLGWAPPVLVFADLGENLFTWVSITLAHNELWILAWLSALGMALSSVIKIVGLAGVLALIVGWRMVRARP